LWRRAFALQRYSGGPTIAPDVARLTIFKRFPHCVVPPHLPSVTLPDAGGCLRLQKGL
jgi:hypothetical protein